MTALDVRCPACHADYCLPHAISRDAVFRCPHCAAVNVPLRPGAAGGPAWLPAVVVLTVMAGVFLVGAGGLAVGAWLWFRTSAPAPRVVAKAETDGLPPPEPGGPLSGVPREVAKAELDGAAPTAPAPDDPFSQPADLTPAPATPLPPAVGSGSAAKPVPAPTVAAAPAAAPGLAGGLRYGWKKGDTRTYAFKIEATVGAEKRETSGAVTYTLSANGDELQQQRPERQGSGTGFVVSRDGCLVTCAHVVEGATAITASLGGTKYSATIVAADEVHDLALLRIQARDLTALPLGDSAAVQLAQEVRAVGYPLSDVLGSSVKVTRGTIAGFVDLAGERLFQVDASINPGNSGGPVVNSLGHVVGVASAKLAGEEISNVGFAVPAVHLRQLLTRHRVVCVTAAADAVSLDGPELAQRVTPAVALVEVTSGPGGFGIREQLALGYNATINRQESLENALGPRLSPRISPRYGPRVGPGMPRMPGMPHMTVPAHDRGRVVLDAAGRVADVEGGEQLPFLLGPVGLLIVEPLGRANQRTWETRRMIAITRHRADDGHPFSSFARPRSYGGPFAPPSPFAAPRREVVAVTPAAEQVVYELGDDSVTIRKRYQLKTVSQARSEQTPGLELSGSGVLAFDRVGGAPRSLTFDATFTVDTGQTTVRVPLKLTYRYVPAAELAAAKPPVSGGSRPPAVRPPSRRELSEADIAGIIGDLKSSDQFKLRMALTRLMNATARPRQEEVARALEVLLHHADTGVRILARRALRDWATKESVPVLLQALAEDDPTARSEAIAALGHVGDARAAEAIAAVFEDNRYIAKEAFQQMGAVAEPAVLTLLKHKEWAVRHEACELLGTIGTERSLPALQEAAGDDNGIVKRSAERAIEAIKQRPQPK